MIQNALNLEDHSRELEELATINMGRGDQYANEQEADSDLEHNRASQ